MEPSTDTVKVVRNWIGGAWAHHDGPTIDVVNPATGQVVARQPDTAVDEVARAVEAARRAFDEWRWQNPRMRAERLHAIADRVAVHETTLARSVTLEMGKPLGEATGEVQKLAQALHFYAEEATRIRGSIVPNTEDGFTSLVEHEPVGVVAAISPWNYPLELIGWKLGAALASGCTLVIKPSEYTPSCAVQLMQCVAEAGAPAGVVNLVTGAGDTGRALTQHPGVDKIAFTGSGLTGAAIARSVPGVKPMSMELGGNCPMIVTDKADVAAAVKGAVRRGFRNAGQICIAVNRIYVHESVYREFIGALAGAAEKLVVADGLGRPDADVGPVANREIHQRTLQHLRDAVDRGARLLCGGGAPADAGEGLFLMPTVVVDCDQSMLVMHEETFGPLVGVASYQDIDEAIALANSTDAGLAAYAYTEDLSQAFHLSRRLDFGNVAVNNVDAGIINAPYGGRKGSGHGSEHGREGMDGYLQIKHTRMRHGA
jgi:succinate-semialdehyde dehydrogenase/glutarate-semialdehyde dehydrogenase